MYMPSDAARIAELQTELAEARRRIRILQSTTPKEREYAQRTTQAEEARRKGAQRRVEYELQMRELVNHQIERELAALKALDEFDSLPRWRKMLRMLRGARLAHVARQRMAAVPDFGFVKGSD